MRLLLFVCYFGFYLYNTVLIFFFFWVPLPSVRVTSDTLPDRLEKEMHKYIRGKVCSNEESESIITEAVAMYAKRNIYTDNDKKRIDFEKLKTAMNTYTAMRGNSNVDKVRSLEFLRDNEIFGTHVVAFLIQRYRATSDAVKFLTRITAKEDDGQQRKCTRSRKNGDGGGGEVYNMFTSTNCCILDNELCDKVCEIANQPSTTNYFKMSRNGSKWHDNIVDDIQKHMNAYYKSKRRTFNKKLYPHAHDSENMEVYIKSMYLFERGLLQAAVTKGEGEDSPQSHTVNIVWCNMGEFHLFIYLFLYIYFYQELFHSICICQK